MAKNVHIVPHMHWDREWYFTTEESRILLVNNMEEIMERLENDENYPHYVLDGQTAILEDYFQVKPEARERVKKLVQQGKLIIGPWYTQTDEMVVGGESIARNLLYGMKDCKEFGEPMMIGYLPDSFGQSEKLPLILNNFDIERAIFWRGASERHGTTKNNFYWESNAKGRVLTHLMPLGYAIGKYLPVEKEALETRMSKYMPVLERGAVNEAILLPNGHDQMPVQKNIYDVMDQLKNIYPDKNFFLSKYENVFEEVEKVEKLDTIQGELLDGKYMRVHRSIFSTRADLKAYNTRIENKITNRLEPLASMAYHLGFEYHEGLIEHMWKEIMKNHAHDSIGCCCSDHVHKDIENRFFLAENKADELIRFYKRKITDAMSCEITLDKFVAFNLLPYLRESVIEGQIITKMKNFELKDAQGNKVDFEIIATEVVDAGLIDRQIVHYGNYDPFVKYTINFKDTVPAMGYKAYLVHEVEGEATVLAPTTNLSVENDFYEIQVEANGTLTIKDKKTNAVYHDVLMIEDGSDDGDEYDFSPLADDFIITSKDAQAKIKVETTTYKSVIDVEFTLNVPANLDERKDKVAAGSMDVHIVATLKQNSPVLELSIDVDNRACDHRVRLLVPSHIPATHSISDNQFGSIERPVVDAAMEVWESENWDERPDSIYPMLSYVALAHHQGLAVLTNSVREFEVIGEEFDTIAITLFRSVGFLGKEEMLRRPGRPSGIKLATPDSQLLTKLHFDVAIVANSASIARDAKEYTTPIEYYNKMPYNAMKLNAVDFTTPYEFSLFEVDSADFITSVVKKAQDKEGIIVRAYQVSQPEVSVHVTSACGLNVVAETNMNERELGEVQDNQFVLENNVAKTILLK